MVYIHQSQPLSSSHAPRPFLRGTHMSVPYVCVSISALQVKLRIPFSRFHIYALIYDIFLFLTYFTLYDCL